MIPFALTHNYGLFDVYLLHLKKPGEFLPSVSAGCGPFEGTRCMFGQLSRANFQSIDK